MAKPSHYPPRTYGKLIDILPVITGKRLARFLSKIDRTGKCHLWTGGTNAQGYGLVQGSIDYQGFTFLAHRVAWALHNDREPGDLVIRHSCDTPACCRHGHLLHGTQHDNIQDMIVRGRANFHGSAGRPPDLEGRAIALQLHRAGRPIAEICATVERHRATVYRWLDAYGKLASRS